jgi:DNA-directed RNA polymerase specialized sigma24 family protein
VASWLWRRAILDTRPVIVQYAGSRRPIVSGGPALAGLQGTTGKEFFNWLHKMADCRLRDLERLRRRRRKRGAEKIASLDGDAATRKLAMLLADDGDPPEAVALMQELQREVRGAMRGLPFRQRLVAEMVMADARLPQIVADLGPAARADWRAAKAHLRRALEQPAVKPPRKPK